MKHPPCGFAAPPSLAFGRRGAHPAAWQSQFRGCPGMACSAAIRWVGHPSRAQQKSHLAVAFGIDGGVNPRGQITSWQRLQQRPWQRQRQPWQRRQRRWQRQQQHRPRYQQPYPRQRQQRKQRRSQQQRRERVLRQEREQPPCHKRPEQRQQPERRVRATYSFQISLMDGQNTWECHNAQLLSAVVELRLSAFLTQTRIILSIRQYPQTPRIPCLSENGKMSQFCTAAQRRQPFLEDAVYKPRVVAGKPAELRSRQSSSVSRSATFLAGPWPATPRLHCTSWRCRHQASAHRALGKDKGSSVRQRRQSIRCDQVWRHATKRAWWRTSPS